MRHEIAGELHDHISQNLAASKIRLEMLRSKQSSAGREDSLRVAIDLLRECIHSTSDLTRKLAQPALAQLGLVQALGALVAEYQADHPVTFVFEGCEPIDDLDGAVADTVYRGVGELLHNIIKHAGATRASVRLSRAGSRLRIQVVDDGVGLRVDDLGPRPGGIGGFGLSSLRERLREAGGTLAIHSSPGSGCSVIFEIPIDGAGLQETG
jgi:signal transduction histidine kinase